MSHLVKMESVPARETKSGTIISILLSLLSMAAVSVCLSRRVSNVKNWKALPLVCWLILFIYTDSMIFVIGSAIISNGFGIDSSKSACSNTIMLCLGCYLTTKVLIYYFLVERAYIIRSSTRKPRLKDRLYLFNSFGMLLPYCVVIVLNFRFRFAIYDNHSCRIGMKQVAMIPLIGFDILVNVYLTLLFLLPLRSLYTYKTNRNSQVRTVALRSFIGSCATLTSSVVNLTFLMVLRGEPGWICLMCCNVDILFSVLVLHWITSKDNASTLINAPHARSAPGSLPDLPSSPRHITPHPPIAAIYEPGTRSKHGVTTLVTSRSEDKEDTMAGRMSTPPPGVVTVETECRMRVSDGDSERMEVRMGTGLGLGPGTESTESVKELGLWRADSTGRGR